MVHILSLHEAQQPYSRQPTKLNHAKAAFGMVLSGGYYAGNGSAAHASELVHSRNWTPQPRIAMQPSHRLSDEVANIFFKVKAKLIWVDHFCE